ncbi:hypothetical protein PS1_004546 [Malus domestica]
MEFLPSVSDLFYLPVPLHLFGCSNYSASCFVVGELVIKVVFLKISKGKRWSSNIGVFVCKPFVIKIVCKFHLGSSNSSPPNLSSLCYPVPILQGFGALHSSISEQKKNELNP